MNKTKELIKSWLFIALLIIYSTTCLVSCTSSNESTEQAQISALVEKIWALSENRPDGFTLDLRTMSEPTEGISVAYAETMNSCSRKQLEDVVRHAIQHNRYVGGWLDTRDSVYYFDSVRLFPESSLKEAIQFGKENEQYSAFILSSNTLVPMDGTISRIVNRDTIYIGTTGDYRPLTFREPSTGEHWGFAIELSQEIANRMGVNIVFVGTSWPTLTSDVLAEPQMFDFAIGGITITDTRRETMDMSDGYLGNGKTILCRATEADRYQSLANIDKPEVRVMVNPGGLNEKFANENLTQTTIMVHPRNEEIPSLIAEGQADIMITEITEAPYYVKTDSRLAAPLLNTPFTRGQIGVLMRKGQEDLLQMINNIIRQLKEDNTLRHLHEKYGLVYAY